ncbi:MAG: hypothetical protein FWD61_11260 [Phycisphaerales bacterium]|nr:hypothetical protein [Phycisphaerales bacterium]
MPYGFGGSGSGGGGAVTSVAGKIGDVTLVIGDVNSLQSMLDAKVSNPLAANLNAGGKAITNIGSMSGAGNLFSVDSQGTVYANCFDASQGYGTSFLGPQGFFSSGANFGVDSYGNVSARGATFSGSVYANEIICQWQSTFYGGIGWGGDIYAPYFYGGSFYGDGSGLYNVNASYADYANNAYQAYNADNAYNAQYANDSYYANQAYMLNGPASTDYSGNLYAYNVYAYCFYGDGSGLTGYIYANGADWAVYLNGPIYTSNYDIISSGGWSIQNNHAELYSANFAGFIGLNGSNLADKDIGITFPPLSSASPSAPAGTVYFDSSSNTLKFFDGTSWRTIQTI